MEAAFLAEAAKLAAWNEGDDRAVPWILWIVGQGSRLLVMLSPLSPCRINPGPLRTARAVGRAGYEPQEPEPPAAPVEALANHPVLLS